MSTAVDRATRVDRALERAIRFALTAYCSVVGAIALYGAAVLVKESL